MPRKKTGLASSTKKRYIKSTCHCLILCQNIVGGLYTIISEGKFTQSSQKNSLDRKGKKDYSLIHRQFYKDLQGRVQFPTGGIAHEPQGMIR